MLVNRPRAIEYMRRYSLDALVATSPVNVTYFTDYSCWLDALFKEYMTTPGASSNLAPTYAVFPTEGDPALVIGPMFAVNAADLWVRDLYTFGDPGLDDVVPPTDLPDVARRVYELLHAPRAATPTEALLRILRERRLEDARLGVETEGLPPGTREMIAATLPRASIKDCTNLLRLIRMVKSSEELDRMARAATVSEAAAMESLSLARPGRPVAELIARFRVQVAEQGADFDHFAFGVKGLGIATEPDYVLDLDDVLYVDFGCTYRRYYSDSGTTLALRPPPSPLRERHAALRAAFAAGIEMLRPGIQASTIQAAMSRALAERGVTASYPHGHGIGLEVRDYPILVPDNGRRIRDDCVDEPSDLPLEVDMVLNLEAAVFVPGVGSVHSEQSFVVTAEGSRPLVSQERSQPFVPPGTIE